MTTSTEPTKKKRNTTGPLDEFEAASQIVRLHREAYDDADLEEEVRREVTKRREKRRKSAGEQAVKRLLRVPGDKRENVVAHVLRALGGTCGFDLKVSANDQAPLTTDTVGVGDTAETAEDDFPPELPAGTRPMSDEQSQRVARLTGKGRG